LNGQIQHAQAEAEEIHQQLEKADAREEDISDEIRDDYEARVSAIPEMVNSLTSLKEEETVIVKHCLKLTRCMLAQSNLGASKDDIGDTLKKWVLPYMASPSSDVKECAFECLGLAMVIDEGLFREHMNVMTTALQEELYQKKKSKFALTALKCLFDCFMVHAYMVDSPGDKDAFEKGETRNLLLQLLRDKDLEIRHLATEGFCRLLFCERLSNPQEYIARLILLRFENSKQEGEQQSGIRKIKKCLDDFFAHFVRLSKDRCLELFLGALFILFYLTKGVATKQIDPQWANINEFYLFGSLAEVLKYKYNKSFSIFDFQDHRLSFHYSFFKFFSYILLSKDVDQVDKDAFKKFVPWVLQPNVVDYEEAPLLPNFS